MRHIIIRKAGKSVPLLYAAVCALTVSLAFPAPRPAGGQAQTEKAARDVACFLAEGFPALDAPALTRDTIRAALEGLSVEYFTDPDSLAAGLKPESFRALLLPYGSAFPADAWPAIKGFLGRGGSLVYLGGNPFSVPVRRTAEGWKQGTPQPTFARELLIGPAEEIAVGSLPFYSGAAVIPAVDAGFGATPFPLPKKVFEPTARFATSKYFRDEDGGTGPREAVARPLFHVVNAEGLPFACPLYVIDRTGGEAAGGRWVVSASDAQLPAAVLRRCVELALQGSSELKAQPVHASVFEGETPLVRVTRLMPGRSGLGTPRRAAFDFRVEVRDKRGKRVFQASLPASGTEAFASAEAVIKTAGPLAPGLYLVDVACSDASVWPGRTTTGFRVFDRGLLASGPKLSAGRDWLFRDGRVFPVVGTTYMASDVAREFLFEPNPAVWARDFAEMKRAGVNMVRTGIWTGWPRMLLAPGAFDEGALRALDAFVQTAAENDIVVCFNFFAFSPPLGGGTHPYLDPRALKWQKDFITAIVSRYRGCGWVHWDLINEPSYSPPDDLWKNAPIKDSYEREAWKKWLLEQRPGGAAELADDWRVAGGDVFSPPSEADLAYAMIRDRRAPRKGLDFSLFTQDVVTEWAAGLAAVIRAAGGGLVTLGQDEGGAANRPKQQFHYTAVDYTSIHTWWLNDDLLWDVVSTKVPEKPNLVSETGLMRLEDIDGRAWRGPEEARNLLERKFAYAFMGRGAGVLQWIWDINPYMPIDNEAVIGFRRPDGTFKLEVEVLRDYAAFFRKAAAGLADFEPERVVVVSPDARLFSGQPQALDGVQRLVRVLAEEFGLVPAVVSDFRLGRERLDGARLVIVPSPQWLPDSAAGALAEAARDGIKVLFTGAVEGNEYGKPSPAFLALGIDPASAPVSRYERTKWGAGAAGSFATFGGLKSQHLRKSLSTGAGLKPNISHEPLPLEYAEEREPLAALLRASLDAAGVAYGRGSSPAVSRVLLSRDRALAVLVNESSADLDAGVSFDGRVFDVPVRAGRTRLVLFDRRGGRVLAVAGPGAPDEIKERAK